MCYQGKFHPHGDQSVYDALVRMAQDFVMLHPLVAGHGNFGSGDNTTMLLFNSFVGFRYVLLWFDMTLKWITILLRQ